MAQNIILTSGSLLIGNPITFAVTADSPTQNTTFHQVKLEIKASLVGYDTTPHTFTMAATATKGATVQIDIASALRSIAEQFTYNPLTETYQYPYISYTLTAYDSYMIGGILYDRQGERNYSAPLYAIMGAFTDIERYLATSPTKTIQRLSRKPSTGEVCTDQQILIYPTPFASAKGPLDTLTAGPTTACYSLANLSGTKTYQGHQVYVTPDDGRQALFQFVNSLGVIETISAPYIPEREATTSAEEYALSTPATFNTFARQTIRKQPIRQQLTLSSPPLTPEWEEWWAFEFLATPQAWIRWQGAWIPCTITPTDDTIKLASTLEGDITTIDFTVKLNLYGSMQNRL